jgi:DNA-directed RNA polymerase specialized sigma24 family protein
VLRFFEELSYAEMAQVLGVSETAVRKRVTAALRQLAVLLQTSPSPKRGEQA